MCKCWQLPLPELPIAECHEVAFGVAFRVTLGDRGKNGRCAIDFLRWGGGANSKLIKLFEMSFSPARLKLVKNQTIKVTGSTNSILEKEKENRNEQHKKE